MKLIKFFFLALLGTTKMYEFLRGAQGTLLFSRERHQRENFLDIIVILLVLAQISQKIMLLDLQLAHTKFWEYPVWVSFCSAFLKLFKAKPR
jgi:putative Mn2+ efflux pump MntP